MGGSLQRPLPLQDEEGALSLQRVCTLDSLCTAARRPTSPSATSCPSATCLREPLFATLRRRPVTVASLPGLRATTQLSSPTTPTPRGPGSSCPPAPRRLYPLPTAPWLDVLLVVEGLTSQSSRLAEPTTSTE